MNFKELKKIITLYIVGFTTYISIEVIWTSTQHIYDIGNSKLSLMGGSSLWMGILGGFMFLILGMLNEIEFIRTKLPLALQTLLGGLIITIIEFITGMFLNVYLNLGIWDYTGFPLANLFYNQINLFHSLLWCLLSPFAFWLDDVLRWVFYKLGNCKKSNGIYSFFWYIKHLIKLSPPQI